MDNIVNMSPTCDIEQLDAHISNILNSISQPLTSGSWEKSFAYLEQLVDSNNDRVEVT